MRVKECKLFYSNVGYVLVPDVFYVTIIFCKNSLNLIIHKTAGLIQKVY
jgi:hypothetical protein